MDSADFRSMFPLSFGEKKKVKKVINIAEKNKRKAEKEPEKEEEKPKEEEEEEGAFFGPQPPEEKEEPEVSSTTITYERFKLPVSHEAVLHGHTKAVSALALDRKGARILSGSYDCTVKMWDLHGMNHTLQSFRSLEPEEGNHIRQLQYSISGDRILCCTGSSRPKIFDREGVELCQFVRGDMYITDLQHTYGHVTEVTQGWWHPTEVDMIITSSGDGTIRIWDVNYPRRNREVLKLKDKAAKRTNVTCCAYSEDGEMIAGAGRDGSIQVFSSKCWTRPLKVVRDAHQSETETSSLTFANDDVTLLSRGGDHTLKVWDLRRFREPLKEWADLDNFYGQTDAIFSPNEDVIVTGTSNKAATKESKGQGGRLVFFSRQRLAKIASVNITDQSVIRTVWHPELNQIFIGGSDNEMRILFNPDFSKRGALLCVGKAPRRKDATDFIDFMDVSNPHALPMFAEPTRKKPRYDPRKSKTPYKPKNDTPGKGIGGALAPLNLTAHFMKQMVSKQILTKDQDPRAEILKYADKAAADPKYLGRAYAKTQPKPIFLDKDLEEEDERDARLQAIASEVDKKDNKKNYTYGQDEREIERRRRERRERDF